MKIGLQKITIEPLPTAGGWIATGPTVSAHFYVSAAVDAERFSVDPLRARKARRIIIAAAVAAVSR